MSLGGCKTYITTKREVTEPFYCDSPAFVCKLLDHLRMTEYWFYNIDFKDI